MHRYRTTLAALALVAALAHPTFVHAAQATPTTDPAGCVVAGHRTFERSDRCLAISGRGPMQTAPFTLPSSSYRAEWGMRQGGGSDASVELRPADSDDASRARTIVTSPVSTGNGDAGDEAYLYMVTPGTYSLQVNAPYDWYVRLYPMP